MNADKLVSVLQFYLGECSQCNTPCERPDDPTHLSHLAWMCETAVNEHIPAARIDKAMRWLGFVQGVLVARGFYTLAEVREHSREEEGEV